MHDFRPACRDKTSTLTALYGPTGCGKTYSALLFAMGLAYPHMNNDEIMSTIKEEGHSRIFFVDSEGGRGAHYAPGPDMEPDFVNTFPYQYTEITAPYTPEAYTEVIKAADSAGAWVIIVDSTSHEYESEGGILEIADQYEQGIPKKGITNPRDPRDRDGWKDWEVKPDASAGKWKVPKTRHKRFVNRAIQSRAHIIFCLRAEEKMLMEQVPQLDNNGEPKMWNGKIQKKSVVVAAADRPLFERWVPICEKRFMFEMTVSFLLLPDQPGKAYPNKTLQAAFRGIFNQKGAMIGREQGEALADWSMGVRAGTAMDAKPAGSGKQERRSPEEMVAGYINALKETGNLEAMQEFQMKSGKFINQIREQNEELHQQIIAAHTAHLAVLAPDQEKAE